MSGWTIGDRHAAAKRDAMPIGVVRCGRGSVDRRSPAGTVAFEAGTGGSLTVYSALSGHSISNQGSEGWVGNICCQLETPDDATFEQRRQEARLTLIGAELTHQQGGGYGDSGTLPTVVRESFAFTSAVVGAHIADGEEDGASYASLQTALTPIWAPSPQPQYEGGWGKPQVARLDPVDPIEFSVPLGDLTLAWTDQSTMDPHGIDLGLRPSWRLACSKAVGLDRLRDQFVTPLLGLTSLFMGFPDGVDAVHVSGGASPGDRWSGRWHDTRWPLVDAELGDLAHIAQVMSIDTAADDLAAGVEKWFTLFAEHAQMRFIAESLARDGTVLETFMLTIGALEQWYDISRPNDRRMPKQEFRELRQSIRDHIGEVAWSAIADRISHADSHDLRSKLGRIADDAGWPIGKLLRWMPDFVGHAVAYRNGMTHGWRNTPPLTPAGLLWTTRTLQLLLRHDILRVLGFDETSTADSIYRSELGTAIADPERNVLLKDAAEKRAAERKHRAES